MTKRREVLHSDFFKRPAQKVAPELLGKFLVRKFGREEIAVPITEIEIYDGFDDEASHAHKGRTKRSDVMFWEGGHWYIYLCYGMYWMVNIVVGKKDHPSAILIRGAGKWDGPGKLTKALEIDKKLNQRKVLPESGLWVEDRGYDASKFKIIRTPRIGINYAGEPWNSKKWRYLIESGARNLEF